MKSKFVWAVMSGLMWLAAGSGALAQSSVITYQGNLKNNGIAANGSFDFVFALFNASTNGTQIGLSVTNLNVPATNGLFMTGLDFGTNAYAGGNRWLDISVRTNGSIAGFSQLIPRQPITASPLAVFALTGNAGPAGTNGAAGPAGTTGQSATTVYGTASVQPTGGTETLLPGLTQTVTVPTNSVVYIATDGGVWTTSTETTGFSEVDIYLKIDGTIVANGGYVDMDLVNNADVVNASGHWSLSLATALSPGSHTIAAYGYSVAGAVASYNGGVHSAYQGELTVMFLKQ